jgi:hypothetical protein
MAESLSDPTRPIEWILWTLGREVDPATADRAGGSRGSVGPFGTRVWCRGIVVSALEADRRIG